MKWHQIQTLQSKKYICGWCQTLVASDGGYHGSTASKAWWVMICPHCEKPTSFIDGSVVPGTPFGDNVEHLPENIKATYEESRKAYTAGAYTASVLMCRKMLMNIAVDKGAKAGDTFKSYIGFLSSNHLVPPGSDDWISHIKDKGNEATHEIHLMNKEDAEELLSFTSMLLKFIFEFPGKMKQRTAP